MLNMTIHIQYLKTKIDKKNKSWKKIINRLEKTLKNNTNHPAQLYYDLGFSFCKLKKWSQAVPYLEIATLKKPKNISWRYRLALSLENSGKKNEAKKIIADTVIENDNNPEQHYKSGILLLGYSRPIDAEHSFRKASLLDDKNYKYHLFIAIALSKQGKGKSWQAIKAYENALALNPKAAEIHYSLGISHEHMRNYPVASLYYLKAIFLSKKYKNSNNLKEHLEKIKTSLQNKKNEQLSRDIILTSKNDILLDPVVAEDKIREAIKLTPNNPDLYLSLANALEVQGESKYWQEIETLEKAISLQENNAKQFFRMGVLREKMRNFPMAKNNYEQAILKGLKSSELFYRLGYCHEMAGDKKSAENAYSEAIILDSELKSKKFGIGVFHNKFGKKDLAISAFQEESRKNNDNAELFYKLGMAYDRSYQWSNAKKAYKRALKIDNSIIALHFRLGFVYERLGSFSEASESYSIAASKRNRHTPYWYYRLGYSLNKCGKFKDSCDAFIKYHNDLDIFFFQKKQSKSTFDFINSAINDIQENNYSKAELTLTQSINRRGSDYSTFYFLLGLALFKQNKFEDASNSFLRIKVLQEAHGVSDKGYLEKDNIRITSDYNHFYQNSVVRNDLIVYESFQGASISCNPFALFKSMVELDDFKEYNHIWLLNSYESIPDELRGLSNVDFVLRDSDRYYECLSTAKILINNSTFPSYFVKKPGQVYINTWHGTPLKFLGRDMKGRFLEHKNFTRNILQSDILVSPNKFTSDVFVNKHDIRGIYSGQLLETGYPRIDLTLNITKERKSELLSKLGFEKNKKVIFYAPTWRGTHGNVDFDSDKLKSDLDILTKIEDVSIAFRGHSLVEEQLSTVELDNVIILPKWVDTNEFLGCIDILITDYSSVFFDFYSANKPVVYYAYDLEEYSTERGMYFDINTLPGDVCEDIESLSSTVKNLVSGEQLLKNSSLLPDLGFNDYDDGNASKRVIDAIKEKLRNLEGKLTSVKKRSSYSKSYLFYTGPFMRNGITTSFINLANTLVKNGHTVSVAVDVNAISKDQDRLEQIAKLSPDVNIIGRVGGLNFSLEERYIHAERNREHILLNSEMNEKWNTSWRNEFKRIFGGAKFDVIVNFEGYTNFWASLFSSLKDYPVTIFQHNDMHGEYSQKYPYLLGVFNCYNNYKSVISVSKETRDLNCKNISEIAKVPKDKFAYSENLLNLDTIFDLSSDSIDEEDKHIFNGQGPVFINIGRLSLEKDHAKLLYAFKKTLDVTPTSKLIILGEGALKFDLLNLMSELGIEKSVFFLGHKFNPYPYLNNANCFVLSSNHEGQPMTLLESLTLGKDVIATSIAGNNSVLKLINEVGVENSIEGLAKALIDYSINGKKQQSFDFVNYQNKALESFIKNTGR